MMVSELPVAVVGSDPVPADNPLVDVLVRVLVADGLEARRTAPDRLEVTSPKGIEMEWCCVGDLAFGRRLADMGEAAWLHRVDAGPAVAPFEAGRQVGRIVRGIS